MARIRLNLGPAEVVALARCVQCAHCKHVQCEGCRKISLSAPNSIRWICCQCYRLTLREPWKTQGQKMKAARCPFCQQDRYEACTEEPHPNL